MGGAQLMQTLNPSPSIVIVGGVHGAGKSTYCLDFLKTHDWHYITQHAIRNQSLEMLSERQLHKQTLFNIQQCLQQQTPFIVEHTMAGRYISKLIATARQQHYHLHLVYLNVLTVECAKQRIASRVKQGGHNITNNQLTTKLNESRSQFWHQYAPLADAWSLFDNTGDQRLLIAESNRAEITIHPPYFHDFIA